MTNLDFYTEYRQFYICDKDSPQLTDSDNFWTEEAISDRLAIENGILGVGTECYGPVKAKLDLIDKENNSYDIKNFDHIVEGSIKIESGILQVLPCIDNIVVLQINVQPDTYRVRIYSSKLSTVIGDDGDDFYFIEIWPDKWSDRKVIKKYAHYQNN